MIPKTPAPQIATDPVWTLGPESGQPVRVVPTLSQQKQGLIAGASWPAASMNGLLGPLSDHVVALSEIGVRNWMHMPTTGVSALPVDGIYRGIFAAPSLSGNASIVYVFGANAAASAAVLGRTRLGGVDWSTFTTLPACTGLQGMAANSSYLVAVGAFGGKAVYSTDGGTTFTAVNTHTGSDYVDVCELGGTFYGISASSGIVGKSVGNVNYVATATTGAAGLTAIRSGNGSILVWDSTTQLPRISSNGGASWATSPSVVFASGNLISDIRWSSGPGLWMAISNRFEVATSSDGVTWALVKAAQFGSNIRAQLATDGSGVWLVAYSSVDANNLPGACVAYTTDGGLTWKNFSLRDRDCTAHVAYSALQDCFFVALHDVANAREPQIFRSLSTGTGAPIVA